MRGGGRGSGNGGRGFTLLELIVVLALMGLILGLVTPFFAGRLPSARLDSTGREISAAMRQARTLARSDNEHKSFVVDLDARQYGIEGLGRRDIPPGIAIRIVDPVAGEIAQGRYTIRFYESGASEGGTIQLSGGRRRLLVEADPVIGAVVIR